MAAASAGSCRSNSTPSLGTSIYRGAATKKKKKKKGAKRKGEKEREEEKKEEEKAAKTIYTKFMFERENKKMFDSFPVLQRTAL